MRTYNTPHAYYCGIDRHARSLFVHVLDERVTCCLWRLNTGRAAR